MSRFLKFKKSKTKDKKEWEEGLTDEVINGVLMMRMLTAWDYMVEFGCILYFYFEKTSFDLMPCCFSLYFDTGKWISMSSYLCTSRTCKSYDWNPNGTYVGSLMLLCLIPVSSIIYGQFFFETWYTKTVHKIGETNICHRIPSQNLAWQCLVWESVCERMSKLLLCSEDEKDVDVVELDCFAK